MRRKGWIAFRTAGSHSKIDVVGINTKGKEVHLWQLKKKNLVVWPLGALAQQRPSGTLELQRSAVRFFKKKKRRLITSLCFIIKQESSL